MSRLVKPRERPFPYYPVAGVVAGVAIAVAGVIGGRVAGITAMLVGGAFAVLSITRRNRRHDDRP